MNQAKYDSLPAEQKAAIDAASGLMLSKSAEDAWHAKGEKAMADAAAAGNNTMIELTEQEIAAFADITLPIRDKVISELGAESIYKAMQGM